LVSKSPLREEKEEEEEEEKKSIYINEQLNVINLFDTVNIRRAQILFFE